ncbi:hypothetical protein GCM10029964_127640 [Kibdelosporangium lantanae]
MEAWRIIAVVIEGLGGILLVLQSMAWARERSGSTGGSVALTGVVALVVLVVVGLLSLTVLPGLVVWILVAILAATSIVLLHTS